LAQAFGLKLRSRPCHSSRVVFPSSLHWRLWVALLALVMSFQDLGHGPKGGVQRGHASKQQPKQRRNDDECPFERTIRANVQEMQEVVRKAASQLDQAQRSRLSRRASEALDRQLERSEELSQDTSRLFRDWTVHLAGEPSERHRKKFSFEKLQKAFDEEVAHLKDVVRRAAIAQQEALASAPAAGGGSTNQQLGLPGSATECRPVCEDQDAASCDDVERGLLDDADVTDMAMTQAQEDAALRIRANIAQEREEGIRRIQNQVSEVNQMFRDLASIVQEQGQQFESIEHQAETAAVSTKQAVQELRKAVDRQRGTRERLCCMLAAAVFLLCFVILPHMHAMHPNLEHASVHLPAEGGGDSINAGSADSGRASSSGSGGSSSSGGNGS